ncbi:uncharacterized protein LOC115325929 isoform X2 [Ixodes scapularis]|uniref:uncharacterized protein LOC115325929 isoform X2 n=1 Tax=Ixodes scapularis TaxID=6945 RepID=UPI001A9FEFEA|nr:uncharacterized protein LOC115325929 isoform X2 [Ixodes scapularis]
MWASGVRRARNRNARAQPRPLAVRVCVLDVSFNQFGGMAAVYGHYCAAKWCRNTTKSADCSFFRFATDDRASKWIYYSNRPEFKLLPLSKLRERCLCGEHFAASAFRSSRRTRLQDNVCPSVLVTKPLLKTLISPEFLAPGIRLTGASTASTLDPPAAPVEPGPSHSKDQGLEDPTTCVPDQALTDSYAQEELRPLPDVPAQSSTQSFHAGAAAVPGDTWTFHEETKEKEPAKYVCVQTTENSTAQEKPLLQADVPAEPTPDLNHPQQEQQTQPAPHQQADTEGVASSTAPAATVHPNVPRHERWRLPHDWMDEQLGSAAANLVSGPCPPGVLLGNREGSSPELQVGYGEPRRGVDGVRQLRRRNGLQILLESQMLQEPQENTATLHRERHHHQGR